RGEEGRICDRRVEDGEVPEEEIAGEECPREHDRALGQRGDGGRGAPGLACRPQPENRQCQADAPERRGIGTNLSTSHEDWRDPHGRGPKNECGERQHAMAARGGSRGARLPAMREFRGVCHADFLWQEPGAVTIMAAMLEGNDAVNAWPAGCADEAFAPFE